jgi:hypothetical protein
MDRTSAPPQVKLSLVRSISLKIGPQMVKMEDGWRSPEKYPLYVLFIDGFVHSNTTERKWYYIYLSFEI